MEEPRVTIPQGVLRGNIGIDFKGGKFYQFFGIPYAKPPIGDLRFKAPVLPDKWEGILDATKEGSPSISRCDITREIVGSENCLVLNVYTKGLPKSSNGNKPVMVFIHGGGWIYGSNRTILYGPEYLMSDDIVLVTINYRLGILGFLSLEDTSLEVPGNAGLKDQCMALRWVQNNIQYFGGDPNNVTIFGQSAGAASVHYHVLSPMSKGLFHKAIAQSGCSLASWAIGHHDPKHIIKLLGHDGTKDERKILQILEQTPAEKLFEIQEQINDPIQASLKRPFTPVIEKPNKDAFITNHPFEILTSGCYNKVPLMFGYTTREGMLGEYLKDFNISVEISLVEDNIHWMTQNVKGSEQSLSITKKLKDFYFSGSDHDDNISIFLTDTMFLTAIIPAVKHHVSTSTEPVYLYRISVESDLNYLKKIMHKQHSKGVCHSDDLGYLFRNTITPKIDPGSLEEISVKRFSKLWTNFAKYGDPTYKKSEEVNVDWKPVNQSEINFIDIGEELTMHTNPEPERITLWKQIFQQFPATQKYF